MASVVPDINRSPGGAKIRGVLHVYYSQKYQRWIARSWPKGNGGDTNKRRWSREGFSNAVQVLKLCSADDQAFADEWAKATPYYRRDILMKLVMGTLFPEIKVGDRTYVSARIANMDIQQGLDTISTTDGAMVVRTPDGWVAVVPGGANQVLTIDPDTLLPDWAEPTGEGSQDFAITWPALTTTSSASAQATKGTWLTPIRTINCDGIAAYLDVVNGATYKSGIYHVDGTGKIDAIVARSAGLVNAVTATQRSLWLPFAAPVQLLAGQKYYFAASRTDSTNTYALPTYGTTSVAVYPAGPWAITSGIQNQFGSIAKAEPAIGDTPSVSSGYYMIAPTYAAH